MSCPLSGVNRYGGRNFSSDVVQGLASASLFQRRDVYATRTSSSKPAICFRKEPSTGNTSPSLTGFFGAFSRDLSVLIAALAIPLADHGIECTPCGAASPDLACFSASLSSLFLFLTVLHTDDARQFHEITKKDLVKSSSSKTTTTKKTDTFFCVSAAETYHEQHGWCRKVLLVLRLEILVSRISF